MRIGIDLGGTKIEAIVLDQNGEERFRRRVPAPREDYAATIGAIATLVRTAIEASGNGPLPLQNMTVGLGAPGAISASSGLVKNSNSTWLIGKPLLQDLEQALKCPVRIENDANCFALSEAVDGAAAKANVVFGVIVGTGTGGGIVVDGKVLRGVNSIAGEWGHNPLPWPTESERPGPRCYCGQSGCIETFLSGPALARDHSSVTGQNLSGDQIGELANAGHVSVQATLARYEDRMARALASIINVLDPDVIVLGGGVSNILRLYDNVPRLWTKYVFSDEVRTRLVRAKHGDSSGVRGAAWLWPL